MPDITQAQEQIPDEYKPIRITDGAAFVGLDADGGLKVHIQNTSAATTASTGKVVSAGEVAVAAASSQQIAVDTHRRTILSPSAGSQPNVWRQAMVALAAATPVTVTNATPVPAVLPAAPTPNRIDYTVPANTVARLRQIYPVFNDPPNNVTLTVIVLFGANEVRVALSSGTNFIWNRSFLAPPTLAAGETVVVKMVASAACNVAIYLEIEEDPT